MGEEQLAEVRNEKLGFVFQDFMLLDGLSVFENICLPQIIANKPIKAMEIKAKNLCDLFGINNIANKYPAEISGGEMPNLIGLSLSLAVQAAQENGYEQIWVRFVTPDDGAEEEKVQRQNPPATLQTSGDTRVELWVNRSYLGDYAADIAINLDIDQEEQPVVVTAQMSNGAEVVLYETTLGVGKQQPISFTGYLRSEGEYTCIVYVGGTEVRRFTNAFMER